MNESIKNFIQQGEKEFDIKCYESYVKDGFLTKDLDDDWRIDNLLVKQFISSRQISLIKMIVERTREKIQEDLDAGGFNMICSNESTFKNYVMGVLSELTDGK